MKIRFDAYGRRRPVRRRLASHYGGWAEEMPVNATTGPGFLESLPIRQSGRNMWPASTTNSFSMSNILTIQTWLDEKLETRDRRAGIGVNGRVTSEIE